MFSSWILLPGLTSVHSHLSAPVSQQYRICQRPPLPHLQHPAWIRPLTLWLQPSIQPRKITALFPKDSHSLMTVHSSAQVSHGYPGGPLVALPTLTARPIPLSSSTLLRTLCPQDLAMLGEAEERRGGGHTPSSFQCLPEKIGSKNRPETPCL